MATHQIPWPDTGLKGREKISTAEAPVDARMSGIASACSIMLLKNEAIRVPTKAPMTEITNSFSVISRFRPMIFLSMVRVIYQLGRYQQPPAHSTLTFSTPPLSFNNIFGY
ncbi:hypothetical protein Ga0074115_10337 [endosymbiont of Ridgeia piscesae]|jgi:hypothetical protein|uniref:Uncharacterized protein n=1 Tax=endosymbiont of Ridgeia piscesae TaxID=54398 RepID=A0A0T5YUC0_9GAMM|nr:hypothetical protein [endosymbiont of Ridgeia piscesae]KRT54140.1 hypothetical protein Ga0074115_10337 [endosymbiont of Ridgeia piscesae]KRT59209.1 hypothetical protein Ga0076813_15025 [endosymbiont of Ridgeia piscesae]